MAISINTAADARHYSLGGTDGGLLENGQGSHGTFAVCEWTLAPGTFAPPLHRHREMDEAMYVLDGEIEVTDGEQSRRLTPGGYAAIPAGTVHTLSPLGEKPARLLIITSAAARTVEMYEALQAAFAAGPPSEEEMRALIARIDMEPVAVVNAPAGDLAN